jgi:hypothetical protein
LVVASVADELLADAVADARRQGASWTEIGDSLGGVSKQAAQKRFGKRLARR